MNLERFKFEFYQSKKKILMPWKLVPEGTKHSVVYEAKFVDIYFFLFRCSMYNHVSVVQFLVDHVSIAHWESE